MAAATRVRPPEHSPGTISRPRLDARVDLRWSRRLVTVVAGPGFGKTTLLAAAVARGGPRPDDRDVWLSCTPDDADEATLLADLATALGRDRPEDLDDLLDAVWLRVPAQMCLILDDLHRVPPDSGGADLLARLVDELPQNGHLVLASRTAVPGPMARLAAGEQLERVTEADLVFDREELDVIARQHAADPARLAVGGGWPALTALTALADDLLADYVWDEVLGHLGPARAHDLARISVVGPVDDELVDALTGTTRGIDELVDGLPLVERGADGWMTLHELWSSVLAPLLDESEPVDVGRIAAGIHRSAGRHDEAIALYAQTGDADELLSSLRDAIVGSVQLRYDRPLGRWLRTVPSGHRHHPAARLAEGLTLAAALPADAGVAFADAAAGFRRRGDTEAEVAALQEHGRVLWWAADPAALLGLLQRVDELADQGVAEAVHLAKIGRAAIGHVSGDPEGVLAALDDIDIQRTPGWSEAVAWFRQASHRRLGDLTRADRELDRLADGVATGWWDLQLRIARSRSAWLRGEVDETIVVLRDGTTALREAQPYLHLETGLELAAHLAWLGHLAEAVPLLDQLAPQQAVTPGALPEALTQIGRASVAVELGDDGAAAEILAAAGVGPGRPDSWIWADRSAAALPYLLCPQQREAWDAELTAPVHRIGIRLAAALVGARRADPDAVSRLAWPAPGVARAHLPRRWLAELVLRAEALGHPPPAELLRALGPELAPALRALGAAHRDELAVEAEALRQRLVVTTPRLTIRLLGDLQLVVGDTPLDHPALRRNRVRELIALLAVERSGRRDALAERLWPDHDRGRHNLRVTLGYLRGALGEDRYLVADRYSLALADAPLVGCDLWDLDRHLEDAARAEQSGDPTAALAAYDAALDEWTGLPLADVVDSDWALDEQRRRIGRLVGAALRAGELHLAAGSPGRAVIAADRAHRADPHDDRVYDLLIRGQLADGTPHLARQTLDAAREAAADLGVPLSPPLEALAPEVNG